jgi:hypothetical protein
MFISCFGSLLGLIFIFLSHVAPSSRSQATSKPLRNAPTTPLARPKSEKRSEQAVSQSIVFVEHLAHITTDLSNTGARQRAEPQECCAQGRGS